MIGRKIKMGKLLERLFGKKEGMKEGRTESYDDIVRKLALGDEEVNAFLESHKTDYLVSTSRVGERPLVEYMAKKYHPELEPYVDFPERLLCVVVDTRTSGIGIPERDVMRVYVDVEEKKVVAKDIVKWDKSGPGRVRPVKV